MIIKKSLSFLWVTGIFLSAVLLQLFFWMLGFRLDTFTPYDYVIFLFCLILIFRYWPRMGTWVKGMLFGIGVWALGYSLLMDLGGIIILKFIPHATAGLNKYYSLVHLLLSPLNWLYMNFQDVMLNFTSYAYPLLIGAIIGLLVEQRRK